MSAGTILIAVVAFLFLVEAASYWGDPETRPLNYCIGGFLLLLAFVSWKVGH